MTSTSSQERPTSIIALAVGATARVSVSALQEENASLRSRLAQLTGSVRAQAVGYGEASARYEDEIRRLTSELSRATNGRGFLSRKQSKELPEQAEKGVEEKLKIAGERIEVLQKYIRDYSSRAVLTPEELQAKNEELAKLKKVTIHFSAELTRVKNECRHVVQLKKKRENFWENTCKRLVGIIGKFLEQTPNNPHPPLHKSSPLDFVALATADLCLNPGTVPTAFLEQLLKDITWNYPL
eukprot:g9524.t1